MPSLPPKLLICVIGGSDSVEEEHKGQELHTTGNIARARQKSID
jgi:hypothetical protein